MADVRDRRYNDCMADILFVLLIVALFGLARLLVTACDRIIGPEEAGPERPPARHEEQAA
mgnify:CR=1 FL=1